MSNNPPDTIFQRLFIHELDPPVVGGVAGRPERGTLPGGELGAPVVHPLGRLLLLLAVAPVLHALQAFDAHDALVGTTSINQKGISKKKFKI